MKKTKSKKQKAKVNLDDPAVIKRYDKSAMLKLIESFPEQCLAAYTIGRTIALPASFKRRYKAIVLTGLGGSAIGADIARSYIADAAPTPVFVNRNYCLPGFVDGDTLVITISYSGNTEETISAYADALRKRAQVIAVTSGGRLAQLAGRDGFPVVKVPGGLPPRCALGYSFFPLLSILSGIGLIPDQTRAVNETIKVLTRLKDRELGHAVRARANIAKDIAGRIYGKFPVVYGGQDHIDCVITRWRGQLAENGKTLSSGHVFPEMNHNEIVGWEHPECLLKDFLVVLLRDIDDHPRNIKRMDITKKILKSARAEIIEVNSSGAGLLARMFSLISIGDFTSFYLAILNKCDPTPVERISYLKKRLAGS